MWTAPVLLAVSLTTAVVVAGDGASPVTPAVPSGTPADTGDDGDTADAVEDEDDREAADHRNSSGARPQGSLEPVPGLDPGQGLDPVPGLAPVQGLAPIPGLAPVPEANTAPSGDSTGGPPGAPEPSTYDPRQIFSGSVRLTGAFFRGDPDAPLTIEDDGLLTTVVRGIARVQPRPWASLELNYFAELSRAPLLTGAGGTFASAGTASSTYRIPWLVWRGWDAPEVKGSVGVDRFVARFKLGRSLLSVGRFPITYTTSNLITPNDFFAPFGATAINRIYKPGVDAVRIERSMGAMSHVEVAAVLGNNAKGVPSLGKSAFITSFTTVALALEWRVLAGVLDQAAVAGGSVQGDIGPLHLHAEGHLGVDTRTLGQEATARPPVYGRMVLGPSYRSAWRNATVGAEVALLTDGASAPSGYVATALSRAPDDLPYLGRWYVSAIAALDLVPVLNLAALALLNAEDGSGLAGLSLSYSAADEVDLILGTFLPWGADATLPAADPAASYPAASYPPAGPVPALASEYGDSPATIYLESRVFF